MAAARGSAATCGPRVTAPATVACGAFAVAVFVVAELLGHVLGTAGFAVRGSLDVACHGLIAFLTCLPACLKRRMALTTALLGFVLACSLDLDHFVASGGLSPEAAVSMVARPPTHGLLGIAVVPCVLGVSTGNWRLAVLLFIVLLTHLLRDATSSVGVPLWWPLPGATHVPAWAAASAMFAAPALAAGTQTLFPGDLRGVDAWALASARGLARLLGVRSGPSTSAPSPPTPCTPTDGASLLMARQPGEAPGGLYDGRFVAVPFRAFADAISRRRLAARLETQDFRFVPLWDERFGGHEVEAALGPAPPYQSLAEALAPWAEATACEITCVHRLLHDGTVTEERYQYYRRMLFEHYFAQAPAAAIHELAHHQTHAGTNAWSVHQALRTYCRLVDTMAMRRWFFSGADDGPVPSNEPADEVDGALLGHSLARYGDLETLRTTLFPVIEAIGHVAAGRDGKGSGHLETVACYPAPVRRAAAWLVAAADQLPADSERVRFHRFLLGEPPERILERCTQCRARTASRTAPGSLMRWERVLGADGPAALLDEFRRSGEPLPSVPFNVLLLGLMLGSQGIPLQLMAELGARLVLRGYGPRVILPALVDAVVLRGRLMRRWAYAAPIDRYFPACNRKLVGVPLPAMRLLDLDGRDLFLDPGVMGMVGHETFALPTLESLLVEERELPAFVTAIAVHSFLLRAALGHGPADDELLERFVRVWAPSLERLKGAITAFAADELVVAVEGARRAIMDLRSGPDRDPVQPAAAYREALGLLLAAVWRHSAREQLALWFDLHLLV